MAKFKILAALFAFMLVLAIPHVSKAQSSSQDQNSYQSGQNSGVDQNSGTSQDQSGTTSSSSSSSSSSRNQGMNQSSDINQNQPGVSRRLPRTASNLPLIGLSGLIALGLGAGLSLAMKK